MSQLMTEDDRTGEDALLRIGINKRDADRDQEMAYRVIIDQILAKELLTDRERSVFELRFGGLTYEAIGRRLGISRVRVKQLWDNAAHKIRNRYPNPFPE